MKNGGSIKGWAINDEASIEGIYESLVKLSEPQHFTEKYSLSETQDPYLFAAGDGNHSLATAKACWER